MLFSHSRIRCFEECPQSFKYKYVEKVDIPYFETVEQYMGSRVHEALDRLYRDLKCGGGSLDDVLSYYDAKWHAGLSDGVVVNGDGLTHEDYYAQGLRCIRGYWDHNSPLSAEHTLGTEVKVDVDLLGDGNYRLVGFIDRLERRGGLFEIHDYKTGRKLPGQKAADADRQLAIYEMGVRQRYGAGEFEYVWHYLSHGRQVRSKRTGEALEKHKADLVKSIRRIEEAVVEEWYPAVRTPRCRWCEYQGICKEGKAQSRQTRLA
jgi:putative RecB family exonuclease